jgi:hypothetical protein
MRVGWLKSFGHGVLGAYDLEDRARARLEREVELELAISRHPAGKGRAA